jgi:hypothetical protein
MILRYWIYAVVSFLRELTVAAAHNHMLTILRIYAVLSFLRELTVTAAHTVAAAHNAYDSSDLYGILSAERCMIFAELGFLVD